MRCPKCNFEVNKKDKFCPYCGQDLNKEKEVIDAEVVNENKENEYSEGYDKEDIEKNKIYSLFSYLSFLFIIPLIACPNSKYAKFHINQGIVLCILNVLCSAIVSIFNLFQETVFFELAETGLDAIVLILSIYGIYNAVTGKAKKLPVIGNITILK